MYWVMMDEGEAFLCTQGKKVAAALLPPLLSLAFPAEPAKPATKESILVGHIRFTLRLVLL